MQCRLDSQKGMKVHERLEKFKEMLGFPQDEDYEEEDVDILAEKKDAAPAEPSISSTSGSKQNKVVNIHTTTQLQVVLVKPGGLREARPLPITSIPSTRWSSIWNPPTRSFPPPGGLFKRRGLCQQRPDQKVANNTYIITPYNVNIMGDLLDELENNGCSLSGNLQSSYRRGKNLAARLSDLFQECAFRKFPECWGFLDERQQEIVRSCALPPAGSGAFTAAALTRAAFVGIFPDYMDPADQSVYPIVSVTFTFRPRTPSPTGTFRGPSCPFK